MKIELNMFDIKDDTDPTKTYQNLLKIVKRYLERQLEQKNQKDKEKQVNDFVANRAAPAEPKPKPAPKKEPEKPKAPAAPVPKAKKEKETPAAPVFPKPSPKAHPANKNKGGGPKGRTQSPARKDKKQQTSSVGKSRSALEEDARSGPGDRDRAARPSPGRGAGSLTPSPRGVDLCTVFQSDDSRCFLSQIRIAGMTEESSCFGGRIWSSGSSGSGTSRVISTNSRAGTRSESVFIFVTSSLECTSWWNRSTAVTGLTLWTEQFCEDNSSRSNPARSAGSFHSTTRSFVCITWKNFAPYFDKVGNLKSAQGLSRLAIVEPCHDALCSGFRGYFFSSLSSSNHWSKRSTFAKLGKKPSVFLTDGIGTAKCPLMRAEAAHKVSGVQCRGWQSQRHRWILGKVVHLDGTCSMFELAHGILNQTMSPRFFFSWYGELDVLIAAEVSKLLRNKAHAIVRNDHLRFWIVRQPGLGNSLNHLSRAFGAHLVDAIGFHQWYSNAQLGRIVNQEQELDLLVEARHNPFWRIKSKCLPRSKLCMSCCRRHIAAWSTTRFQTFANRTCEVLSLRLRLEQWPAALWKCINLAFQRSRSAALGGSSGGFGAGGSAPATISPGSSSAGAA